MIVGCYVLYVYCEHEGCNNFAQNIRSWQTKGKAMDELRKRNWVFRSRDGSTVEVYCPVHKDDAK